MVLWFGSGNRPVATGTSLIDSTLIVSFGGNVRTYDLMVINNLLDIHFDDCLIRQNNIVPDNMPFSGNMLSCKDIANVSCVVSRFSPNCQIGSRDKMQGLKLGGGGTGGGLGGTGLAG